MLQYLTLFIDLDGVLADFDARFKEHHDKFFAEYAEEEAWDRLKLIPDFWLNLEPMPDAYNLIVSLQLKEIPIIILSSPGSHDEKRARYQKRLWVNKHLGTNIPLIMCPAKEKRKFAGRDRVLIDDMPLNIQQWKESGGHGILHISTEETWKQFTAIENSCQYLNWLKDFTNP